MFSVQALECARYTLLSTDTRSRERTVKDYEIDFHLQGNFHLILNGTEYPIPENAVVFRRPGQRCSSFGTYDCWILTLDFSNTRSPEDYTRHHTFPPQCSDFDSLLDTFPSVFLPRHPDELRKQFQTLHEQFSVSSHPPALYDLVFTLLSDGFHTCAFPNSLPRDPIADSIQWMEHHLSSRITVADLAQQTFLSTNHYSFLFHRQTGLSPIQYLIRLRIKRAQELLTQTDFSLSFIAAECGYTDPSFFIRTFRQISGESPHRYRKNHSHNPL